MSDMPRFPKWGKVWLFWTNESKWDFTPVKENIPDGALSCEYSQNNDPFICKVEKTIIEEPLP